MAKLKATDPNSPREMVRSRGLTWFYGVLLALCGLYYGLGLGTYNSFLADLCDMSIESPTKILLEDIKRYVSLCFVLGCTSAGLIGGKLIEKLGCFKLLVANTVFGIIILLPLLFIPARMNTKVLYTVRYLQGISAYLWTTISPVLMRETLPTSISDMTGPMLSSCIAGGILVGYTFGAPFFVKNPRVVLVFLPAGLEFAKLALFLALFRMESPAWLLAQTYSARDGKTAEEVRRAKLVSNYKVLYNNLEAEALATEVISAQKSGNSSFKVKFFDLFGSDRLTQTLLVLMLSFLNQLTGMNIITMFSTDIMTEAGITADYAKMFTNGLGFLGFVATVFLIFFKGYFGVRTLMVAGLFGQALGLSLFIGGLGYLSPWLIVLGLYLGITGYNLSIGGLLFVYAPDLVPPQFLSYFSLAQWLLLCGIVLKMDKITRRLGVEGIFFIAQICAVVGCVMYLGYGVDTSGKSDEEIKAEFQTKTFMS